MTQDTGMTPLTEDDVAFIREYVENYTQVGSLARELTKIRPKKKKPHRKINKAEDAESIPTTELAENHSGEFNRETHDRICGEYEHIIRKLKQEVSGLSSTRSMLEAKIIGQEKHIDKISTQLRVATAKIKI